MGKKRRFSSTTSTALDNEKQQQKQRSTRQSTAQNSNVLKEEFQSANFDVREPQINIVEQQDVEKDEVGEARFRFYGALTGFTEKTSKPREETSSESSMFDEEEDDEEDDMFSDSQINIVKDKSSRHYSDKKYDSNSYSFNNQPTNKYINSNLNDLDDSNVKFDENGQPVTKQSYVMKLFDRSVDLAQFDDSTPLYAICRSWVANQPKKPWEKKKDSPTVPPWKIKDENDDGSFDNQIKKDENNSKDQQSGGTGGTDGSTDITDFEDITDDQIELKVIAALPPPTHSVKNNGPSVRIPQPLPKYHDEQNPLIPDEDKSLEELPSKTDLIQGHLERWTKIKRTWLEASQQNEERYHKSRRLLQLMYNRTQKEFGV